MELAFVAAIQHLPPRQRAVLPLCDVLGWPAHETARALDASLASVRSALQRARATLEARYRDGRPDVLASPDDRQRVLLERYVRAWENGDLEALVALLREDAILSMPPMREWYRRRAAIRSFFAWAWGPRGPGPFRLLPTRANGQPAFALYGRDPQRPTYRAQAIQVLALAGGQIATVTGFVDAELFAAFGLPAELAG